MVCLLGVTDARSRKKTTKDDITYEGLKTKHKKVPTAILAIEIVDPNENKTSTRNSKRTIESSLGYGYQQPKYEVYKYSQHDIPPYRGNKNVFSGSSSKNSDLLVQKSIAYTLPSQKYTQVDTGVSQQYQPGTRLYSTLDQQGQISQLSTHAPQGYQGLHVPVVILRVYPNQLTDSGSSLHANLPKSHPLASNINSLDIQSLLNNYLQNSQLQMYHQQAQVYQQPIYQTQGYPQQNYQQQEHAYEYETPAGQSYNEEPGQSYNEEPGQSYTAPQSTQSYTPSYRENSKGELLTHENYPSNAHTKVIFKNHNGEIRNSHRDHSTPQPVQTKNINVHVPAGIQEVKVEESEVPYQASPTQEQQQPQQQYYYYHYQQPQGYVQQQEQQQQQYEEPAQHYSGKPIVVADPQVYEQPQEPPMPHEVYGNPNVQYVTAQQYSAASNYYNQLQYDPALYQQPENAYGTETPVAYVTPVRNQNRKLRSKKRNAPKRQKTEEKQ